MAFRRQIIFLAVVMLAAACGPTVPVVPAGVAAVPMDSSVALSWLPNHEDDLKQYNVFWGTDSTHLDQTVAVVSPTTQITLYGLQNGALYYFGIDAENTSGQRSALSNLVSATPAPPTNNSPAPSLLDTIPQDGQINIAPSSALRFEFSQPMDPTTVMTTVEPTLDLGPPTWQANNTILTYPRANPYVGSTHYIFTVVGKSAQGVDLIRPNSFSFTTQVIDVTAPYVIDSSPENNEQLVSPRANIIIDFSEAMAPGDFGFPVTVTPDFPWSEQWSQDRTSYALFPNRPLNPATTYTVTLKATATDAAGNPAVPYSFTFTTAPGNWQGGGH